MHTVVTLEKENVCFTIHLDFGIDQQALTSEQLFDMIFTRCHSDCVRVHTP